MIQETKTVLITGAGGGIGLKCVESFLKNDWTILAHFRTKNPELESLSTKHEQIQLIQADFENSEEVERLFSKAIQLAPQGIFALINNAAITGKAEHILEISEENFDQVMQVNAKAPLMLSSQFIKHRRSLGGHGRIVNISSVGVKFGGGATTSCYAMSKSCLELQSRSLSKEVAKDNILINTVQAGVVDTKIHQDHNKNLSERAKMIPLQRTAQPEEIAQVIYFLCSPESSYMTGGTIPVTGGE